MFNRQKAILELVACADRPVSDTELTKWSFLLRHETDSAGGSAFYSFVPYQRGPFSFALNQELGKLRDRNYLKQSGETWSIVSEVDYKSPDRDLCLDIARIVEHFAAWDTDSLLGYVRDSYPEFTSEVAADRSEHTTPEAIYTAGYEGLSIDEFLTCLIKNDIKQLIDVRHNPIARRFGFHRSTLNRLCGQVGINYIHVPELGIHSSMRQDLETLEARRLLFDEYEETTLSDEPEAVAEVAEAMASTPSVLVCMEAEAHCCHRSRVAEKVSAMTDLPIENL